MYVSEEIINYFDKNTLKLSWVQGFITYAEFIENFRKKNHQVVDFWVTDEISASEIMFWKYLENVSLILCNYKKSKEDKIFIVYNFFYFKCAINLNDNCRLICKRTNICPLNIMFIHKFLYIIIITSIKNFILQNNLTRKTMKRFYSVQISAKLRKTAYTERKKGHWLLLQSKIQFFWKSKLYKIKFVTRSLS